MLHQRHVSTDREGQGDWGNPYERVGLVSGERPIPVRPGLVSTGINPMRRGLASLEGPWSLLSQWSEQSLQGLTCEKKTKSIVNER